MAFVMGPVLYFRGTAKGCCQLAALVVIPSGQIPPLLTVADGEQITGEALATRLDNTVWRYSFSVPLDDEGKGMAYAIGDQCWRVYPPSNKALRVAYTACNGFEHGNYLNDADPERNERWRHLAAEHARAPFQLLIQGGDQLYADDVWREIPELRAWDRQNRGERVKTHLSPQVVEAIADFYFSQYCRLWAQRDLAPLLASIPSLMMWDDHDIFDGWGSHHPDLQRCPVFQSIWTAAREQFALFQLACRPDELSAGFGDPGGGHFGWFYRLGDVGIIAPDLRSERTRERVMSETGWRWLLAALEQLGQCRSVLFVSTVPVLNIDLSFVERSIVWLPPGRHLYQDDLRDQWRSYGHRSEWRRLVQHLLDFAERTRALVAILSGEVHLGALGIAERGKTRLFQLTSSGIVHHPPPRLLASLFDWFGRGKSTVAEGIKMQMLPLPGLGNRYLAERNWLSLEYALDGNLGIEWHAEKNRRSMKMTLG